MNKQYWFYYGENE